MLSRARDGYLYINAGPGSYTDPSGLDPPTSGFHYWVTEYLERPAGGFSGWIRPSAGGNPGRWPCSGVIIQRVEYRIVTCTCPRCVLIPFFQCHDSRSLIWEAFPVTEGDNSIPAPGDQDGAYSHPDTFGTYGYLKQARLHCGKTLDDLRNSGWQTDAQYCQSSFGAQDDNPGDETECFHTGAAPSTSTEPPEWSNFEQNYGTIERYVNAAWVSCPPVSWSVYFAQPPGPVPQPHTWP